MRLGVQTMPNPTVYLSHEEWDYVTDVAEEQYGGNYSPFIRSLVQDAMPEEEQANGGETA